MLKREDNELVTRVGPGTPMGNLMREYWIPALLSRELPEVDGEPMRVRLLGEDLVAFRDSNGDVGLVGERCPHRGASLFFGRNEEGGLRCIYHGWKFDKTGQCVDMPNEPAATCFNDRIKHTAYPTQTRNGVVWVYMGKREVPPPLPDLEWNMTEGNVPHMWKFVRRCNWLQVMEGAMDTAHAAFLHRHVDIRLTAAGAGTTPNAEAPDGINSLAAAARDVAPTLQVMDTDYGVLYSGIRRYDDKHMYHRIHPWLFPFYTLISNRQDATAPYIAQAWIPIDDEHTLVLEMNYRPLAPWTEAELQQLDASRNPHGYMPRTPEAWSQYRVAANKDNDYKRDYQLQKTTLFAGIISNVSQDAAVQESMGPICERWNEHLGSTDAMIIRVRRRLIAEVKALAETGKPPPAAYQPELYRIRPQGVILPNEQTDWLGATVKRRQAFYVEEGPTQAAAAET
jgi:phenylpropionate dioxygenase-like ring-hydroxylating dioxygenase large terminal subunit